MQWTKQSSGRPGLMMGGQLGQRHHSDLDTNTRRPGHVRVHEKDSGVSHQMIVLLLMYRKYMEHAVTMQTTNDAQRERGRRRGT